MELMEYSDDYLKAHIVLNLIFRNHLTLKGYEYLIWIFRQIILEQASYEYITKDIYPMAGEHFWTTPTAIERTIRYAITHVWPNEVTYKIFGSKYHTSPSNAKFIQEIHKYISKNTMDNIVESLLMPEKQPA